MKKRVICGKEFKPKLKTQITCSEECRQERTRRKSREWHREHPKEEKTYTKTCQVCGTKFKTKNVKKIYCTTKCYNAELRRRNREHMANERAEIRAKRQSKNLTSHEALADAAVEARAAGMTYGQWQARRYAYVGQSHESN